MAFAGSNVSISAAGTYPLPAALDAGGNNPGFTLYSHLQTSGAGTIAFDNAPSIVATVPASPVVLAIPVAARSIIVTGTPSIIFGQMT
jgi:hypothetical protein